MQVKRDAAAYDRMQIALLQELVRAMRAVLETKGLSKARVRDITEDLTFHVAAILDGSADVELDGRPVEPRLAFQGRNKSTLLAEPGGSSMHEYAFGCVGEVFDAGKRPGTAAPGAPRARQGTGRGPCRLQPGQVVPERLKDQPDRGGLARAYTATFQVGI